MALQNYFRVEWLLLILSVAALGMGLILIYAGIRGVPDLCAPRCAKCHYDLRALRFDGDEQRCPECGADLKAKRAVRFGEYRWRPVRIGIGGALMVSPFLVLFVLRTVGPMAARGPQALPSQSNATIIASLPKSAGEPWSLRELETRLSAGRLSATEVDQAIAGCIAFIKTARAAGNSSSHHYIEGFITASLGKGAVSPERFKELCLAFYGDAPELKLPTAIRPETRAPSMQILYGLHWNLPNTKLVWCVRQQLLDGQPAPLLNNRDVPPKAAPNRDHLSGTGANWADWQLTVPSSVSPGEHEIEFTFDVGAIASGSRLMGVDGRPGSPDKWPSPRCTWTSVVKKRFGSWDPTKSGSRSSPTTRRIPRGREACRFGASRPAPLRKA